MALEGGEGSASRPGRSLPPGKTRYPSYRRLGGPQGWSGQVQKISPPPGCDPRTVQLVAQSLYRLHYPAHLLHKCRDKCVFYTDNGFWHSWYFHQFQLITNINTLVLRYSYHAHSYVQYIEQQMHSIKYNKMQIIKYTSWQVANSHIILYFSDCASSYNSGRYPTWHTFSSIIHLFESSTCFEQLCAHPQEDNCINTMSGIITLC